MNNPITTITEEDVADALQGAVEMMLAFEKQSLSPIERARVELAMGEHAPLEVRAAWRRRKGWSTSATPWRSLWA